MHSTGGLLQALVIGTDIPDISARILDEAVQALDSHQVLVISHTRLTCMMLSAGGTKLDARPI